MNKKIWDLGLFWVLFAADRLSKMWAYKALWVRDIDFVPGMRFELTWNRGVSFGSFQFSSSLGFLVLSLMIMLITGFLFLHTIKSHRAGHMVMGEVLILAGAVSNLVDRILYGAVLDFIDLYVGPWHWYTFNLADTWIVVGAGIVAYKYLVVKEGMV